jgi:sulfide dehydrogenase subunit beta
MKSRRRINSPPEHQHYPLFGSRSSTCGGVSPDRGTFALDQGGIPPDVLLGPIRFFEPSMPMTQAQQRVHFEILSREDFSDVTYSLVIHHPLMAKAAQPGQFVIVMSHEAGERIPLTIADFDRAEGTVTVVVQAVGKTTKEMQRTCKVGTALYGMVGPMGVPSLLAGKKKVVCVGGGLGVAPIFPQVRGFKDNGAYVIGIVGFRTKDLIFWDDKFKAWCDELILCTDDGSAGMKGFVSDGIKVAMKGHRDIDEVVAIGPPLMMKACAETTRANALKTVVSLNPIMVDGTGMCGGCRVKVGDQVKFACVDGPDFDGHKVDFDDLMMRLRRYAEEEKIAMARWSEHCRMEPPIKIGARPASKPPLDSVEMPDPFEEALGG